MLRLPLAAALAATAVVASVVVPSTASAGYRVGIGDQNAAMFDNPLYQATGVKRVRYIVPWDVYKHPGQQAEVDTFIAKAAAHGAEPFVHFTASRGCWINNKYSRKSSCKAPSQKAYESALKRFHKRYPTVRVIGPWNEANHKSQPTASSPRRAAQYYRIAKRVFKRSTIVGLDVLDQKGVTKYIRDFRKAVRGKSPRIWGLHNYTGVNNKSTRVLRQVLKAVSGDVWLTETGGVVSFGKSNPYSPSRAALRTKTLFSQADSYGKKRKGYKAKISRVYVYQFYGAPIGARFDAGLVGPNGEVRPALGVFAAEAAKRPR